MTIFGLPLAAITGQILLGLINGAFYAMLSLGVAVIFGLLNIVNFAHGAFYMVGAFGAWAVTHYLGLGFWWALVLVPVVVGLLAIVLERTLISRIYDIDHMYGLLLTFGLALILEGLFRISYGSSGLPYPPPSQLAGGYNLGFMYLPAYRAFVVAISVVVCLATWLCIEKTRLGATLRAGIENPVLVETFGINVPLLVTMVYAFGVALAALAGVLAAPIYTVSPGMGSSLVIVAFAVVVIGGLGSISGAIVMGFALGVLEGLTKIFYPQAAATVIFAVMAIVLLTKPAGLFGRSN